MSKGLRIFLQALVLSFLGHIMFFSLFNVQDIRFSSEEGDVTLTLLPATSWASRNVSAATTSDPNALEEIPELVEVRRVTSPKSKPHSEAAYYDDEMPFKSPDPEITSWLMWSLRRETVDYGSIFTSIPMLKGLDASLFHADMPSTGDGNSGRDAGEVRTTFDSRRLVHSPLPVPPGGTDLSAIPPVTLRVGVESSGRVAFAFPEKQALGPELVRIAVKSVSQWRFEPVWSPDEDELDSAGTVEWGYVTVPWAAVESDSDNTTPAVDTGDAP